MGMRPPGITCIEVKWEMFSAMRSRSTLKATYRHEITIVAGIIFGGRRHWLVITALRGGRSPACEK